MQNRVDKYSCQLLTPPVCGISSLCNIFDQFPWIPFQFQYEVSLWCNVLTMDVFPISVENTLCPFIILMPNTPLILADSFLFSSARGHYSHSVDAAMHEQYSQLLARTNDNPHSHTGFKSICKTARKDTHNTTFILNYSTRDAKLESTSKLSSSRVCLKFNKLRPHSHTSTENPSSIGRQRI